MPGYFIDTHDDDMLVEDEDGIEFADVDEARQAALAALPDMVRDKVRDGEDQTFCASVRDEAGTVLFKATLALMGQRGPGLKPC